MDSVVAKEEFALRRRPEVEVVVEVAQQLRILSSVIRRMRRLVG